MKAFVRSVYYIKQTLLASSPDRWVLEHSSQAGICLLRTAAERLEWPQDGHLRGDPLSPDLPRRWAARYAAVGALPGSGV
ncbi:MAG: hypothetical protein E6K49_15235 [Gammaproteobacteria bacterium]|nr:MAG: hypothetical protein E6K49_15235 [Gammaproteobacteria bacterium]